MTSSQEGQHVGGHELRLFGQQCMPGTVDFSQPDPIAKLRLEQSTVLRQRDRILKTLNDEQRGAPPSPPGLNARGSATSRLGRVRAVAIQPYRGCPLHLSHLRVPARTPNCPIIAGCKEGVAYILD